jgi:hypothetical protein
MLLTVYDMISRKKGIPPRSEVQGMFCAARSTSRALVENDRGGGKLDVSKQCRLNLIELS